jgi:hypothetical protein
MFNLDTIFTARFIIENLVWTLVVSALMYIWAWIRGLFPSGSKRLIVILLIPITAFALLTIIGHFAGTGPLTPEMRGNILTVIAIDPRPLINKPPGPKPDAALIFLPIRILNLGSPSIIDDYSLSVRLPDGAEFHGAELKLATPMPLSRLEGAWEQVGFFCPSQDVRLQTRVPIPSGGQIRGFVAFTVIGITPGDLFPGRGAVLTVRFVDVRGRHYAMDYTLRRDSRPNLPIGHVPSWTAKVDSAGNLQSIRPTGAEIDELCK